jgi:hypothetical protein
MRVPDYPAGSASTRRIRGELAIAAIPGAAIFLGLIGCGVIGGNHEPIGHRPQAGVRDPTPLQRSGCGRKQLCRSKPRQAPGLRRTVVVDRQGDPDHPLDGSCRSAEIPTGTTGRQVLQATGFDGFPQGGSGKTTDKDPGQRRDLSRLSGDRAAAGRALGPGLVFPRLVESEPCACTAGGRTQGSGCAYPFEAVARTAWIENGGLHRLEGRLAPPLQEALSRPLLLVCGNPVSGNSPERTPAPPPSPAGSGAGQRRSQPTRAAMAKRAISRELKPISVSVSW